MIVDMSGEIAHRILDWYAENARSLPWRNPPGQPLPVDENWPYRVWLSEIMLQQTGVRAVIPYFEHFTRRWPSVSALAEAADAEVMGAWAGLGYYARARNMLACARIVALERGGRLPDTEAELLSLPGIGRYTAAAIAAIAFGRRAVVIDGNIERVTARIFAETRKSRVPELVAEITPDAAGDFAQAMMDIGATVCLPRAPRCLLCPVSALCRGKADPASYPARPAKPVRPVRKGIAWWIEREGKVLLVTRVAKGLLGGMLALPSGEWGTQPDEAPPLSAEWAMLGTVIHVFTHFELHLEVRGTRLKKGCKPHLAGEWWPIDRIDKAGLPTVFLKAAQRAVSERVWV